MHFNVQIHLSVLTLIFSLYFDFSEVKDLVIFPVIACISFQYAEKILE